MGFILLLNKDIQALTQDVFVTYIEFILTNVSSLLFLEIAILMNVIEWIYYYCVVQAHRNIREEEIKVEYSVE